MAQGNTLEWLRALELIRNIGADFLVPGHGPVVGTDATYRVGEYIEFMRGRVRDYYRLGKNKNETKSGLVGEMLEWFPCRQNAKRRSRARSSPASIAFSARFSAKKKRRTGKVVGSLDDEEEYDD